MPHDMPPWSSAVDGITGDPYLGVVCPFFAVGDDSSSCAVLRSGTTGCLHQSSQWPLGIERLCGQAAGTDHPREYISLVQHMSCHDEGQRLMMQVMFLPFLPGLGRLPWITWRSRISTHCRRSCMTCQGHSAHTTELWLGLLCSACRLIYIIVSLYTI